MTRDQWVVIAYGLSYMLTGIVGVLLGMAVERRG